MHDVDIENLLLHIFLRFLFSIYFLLSPKIPEKVACMSLMVSGTSTSCKAINQWSGKQAFLLIEIVRWKT